MKQWQRLIEEEGGKENELGLDISIAVDDQRVQVTVEPQSNLETFRLKPVIEALNTAKPGLGWYVYQATAAIGANGFPIYHVSYMGDIAAMAWHGGSQTDKDLIAEIRAMEGLEDPSDEEVREHHPYPFPSDVDAEVGQHRWMLRRPGATKEPRPASQSAAERFAKGRKSDPELKAVVQAAVDFMVYAEATRGVLTDEGSVDEDDRDEVERCYYHYEPSKIGGSCFVVWDEARMFHEAVYHYEEMELNAGEATLTHFTFKARFDDAEEVRRIVTQLRTLVRYHTLASKLLNHFPRIDT